MSVGAFPLRLAALLAAAALWACEEDVTVDPVSAFEPTAVATPGPRPAPTATPRPVPTTRRESVTFTSGSIEAQGTPFDVGARGPVEVSVGCHLSFVPFQLVKVDLLAGGSQRVASQRCGAASPTCTDIALGLELERGTYVVRLERDSQYRTWVGYMCDVTVTAP
jgi:hypothetical protein